MRETLVPSVHERACSGKVSSYSFAQSLESLKPDSVHGFVFSVLISGLLVDQLDSGDAGENTFKRQGDMKLLLDV